MLDMYKQIGEGIVIVKDNYFKNLEKQKQEGIEYRKKIGMEQLNTSTVIDSYEYMERMGSINDSVVISPITNKWKDTNKNFEGLGTRVMTRVEIEGLLEV